MKEYDVKKDLLVSILPDKLVEICKEFLKDEEIFSINVVRGREISITKKNGKKYEEHKINEFFLEEKKIVEIIKQLGKEVGEDIHSLNPLLTIVFDDKIIFTGMISSKYATNYGQTSYTVFTIQKKEKY